MDIDAMTEFALALDSPGNDTQGTWKVTVPKAVGNLLEPLMSRIEFRKSDGKLIAHIEIHRRSDPYDTKVIIFEHDS